MTNFLIQFPFYIVCMFLTGVIAGEIINYGQVISGILFTFVWVPLSIIFYWRTL